jgi:hypothetical protein
MRALSYVPPKAMLCEYVVFIIQQPCYCDNMETIPSRANQSLFVEQALPAQQKDFD